MFSKS